jgi:hypothetical protein
MAHYDAFLFGTPSAVTPRLFGINADTYQKSGKSITLLYLGADQTQKRKTKYADTYICLEFLQILSKKSVSTLKELGPNVSALLQESIKNVSAEVRLPHTQKSSPELVRDFVNFALDQFHNRPSEGESEGSTATPPLPVILRDQAKLHVTLSELVKGQHRHMAGMGKAFLTYKKNEKDNFHTLLLFWEEGALFLIILWRAETSATNKCSFRPCSVLVWTKHQ